MAVVGRCPWIDGWTCYGTAAVTRYEHVTAVAGVKHGDEHVTAVAGVEHGDEHDGVEQEGRPGRRAGAQTPAHLRTTLPGFFACYSLVSYKMLLKRGYWEVVSTCSVNGRRAVTSLLFLLLQALATNGRAQLNLIIKMQEYCYDNTNLMKSFHKIVLLFYKGKPPPAQLVYTADQRVGVCTCTLFSDNFEISLWQLSNLLDGGDCYF